MTAYPTCNTDAAPVRMHLLMPHSGAQIEGRENLPAKGEPAVYVANHQSFLVSNSVQRSTSCCVPSGR